MESLMKRLPIATGLALACAGAGCSHSSTSPTALQPTIQSVPVTPATLRTLHGYVGDTAFRPMGGVRVEVLNGPEAGKEFSSDAKGFFSYVGMFSGATSMRATSEGYLPLTIPVVVGNSVDQAWASFSLSPVTPPVEAAGDYTLTISVDSACSGFPDAARVRSYPAHLTKRSITTKPANTQYDGVVSGGTFAPYLGIFWVGVAGDYLAVSTEGEGPSIVEQIAPKTYISYLGEAGASIPAGSPTMISAPFNGTIEYCELKLGIGQYYECSDSLAVARAQCTSANNRLTLTPR
jgi:hypothetical protein